MKTSLLIKQLEERRIILINYLAMKMREEDWHGTQDAASDLRDIDAKLAILRM